MNTNEDNHEVVQHTLSAWREEEVPEHVFQAAQPHLDRLRRLMAASGQRTPILGGRMLLAAGLTTVALVVAAIIAVTVDFAGPPPVAFAQVVRQLETFRPYTCTVNVQHDGKTTREYRLFRYSLGQRREEMTDGTVQIVDLEAKRLLRLTPDRQAILQELPEDSPGQDPDLLSMVAQIGDAEPEPLGYRQVGDVRAYGFRAVRPYNVFSIWVNPETQLPVYFVVEHPEQNQKIAFSDFTFDVDLDAALFSTTPPEGFELVQRIASAAASFAAPVKPAVTQFVPHAVTRVVISENGTVSPPTRVYHQSLTSRREIAADGTITVFDLDAGRILTLHPKTKQANLLAVEGGRSNMDLFSLVAEAVEKPTKVFGDDTIDGKPVWGFEYEMPHNVFDVWLDSESGYPVQVDITHPLQGRTIRMTDFTFAIDLDPALFSTEPPEGYMVTE